MTFREWYNTLSSDERPMMGAEEIYNAGMNEGILYERSRCANGCDLLARLGGSARECADAIRKGEK